MLKYITSNKDKINSARRNLSPLGVEFAEQTLDLIEIQSDSLVKIAIHKARQAYEILKEPLFVSDHGWIIPALNGFPGAYMKQMNQWLSSQDFLNLMKGHEDRRVIKVEVICYIDSKHVKHFRAEIPGKFVDKIEGEGIAAMRVISLHPSGKTVAECIEEDVNSYESNPIWEEFANWYKQNILKN